MATEIKMILLADIDVGARLRPAGEAHVEALAASIARNAELGLGYEGLISPIGVRARAKGETGRAYVLVSGYHRLKALIRLNRDVAPAQVLAADEAEAELQEIEENLIRADLTALDRAIHIYRYRLAFERAYGVVTRGGDRSFSESSGQNVNMTVWSEAAKEKLGISGSALDRAVRIANRIDEISIARLQPSAWADNQKFLLEFVGVPLDMRPDVLDLLLDPENELSLREALAKVGGDSVEEARPKDEVWLAKAFSLADAPAAWRRKFYSAMIVRDLHEVRAAAEANGYQLTPKPLAKPKREEG